MRVNRWVIAAAAAGIHICIGSVYAWSVAARPVMAEMGMSLSAVTWAFSIAILFLGLSAGFLGGFAERMGPRWSGLLSAAFFTAGLLGTALAMVWKSAALLYVSYGCIGGIGIGIGYITPVATLVKWFPRNRGLATGLAIMGFGFASLIAGPLMEYLIGRIGLSGNFLLLAAVYGCVMVVSALVLRPPRIGEAVPAGVPSASRTAPEAVPSAGPQMTRKEAVRTGAFAILWVLFFINITCGIGLLAAVSPMAQDRAGMTAAEAAALVGAAGVLNGLGRIAWSALSDWIGRGRVYTLFFMMETAAFLALWKAETPLLFQGLVLLIVTCYGGGFSCMPAYLSDLFGVRSLSAIHGCILTAWSAAGITGPLFLSAVKEITGGYDAALCVFSFLCLCAAGGALYLQKKTGGKICPAEGKRPARPCREG